MAKKKANKKKANSFQYTHRIMRVFEYLKQVEPKSGMYREDLLARASMMGTILSFYLHDKLQLEGGILSYVPQYAKLKRKEIIRLFGKDTLMLVLEINDLVEEFNSNNTAEDVIRGSSYYAKNIYLLQCYIDTVELFTCQEPTCVLNGMQYAFEENTVTISGETYPEEDFHQWWIEMLVWKIEFLEYGCSDIMQAIRELIKQYRENKGFEFDLSPSYLNASSDRSPAGTGVDG